jgi:hypothetical protein
MASFRLDQVAYGTELYVRGDSGQTKEVVETFARTEAPYADRGNWEFATARCQYDPTPSAARLFIAMYFCLFFESPDCPLSRTSPSLRKNDNFTFEHPHDYH